MKRRAAVAHEVGLDDAEAKLGFGEKHHHSDIESADHLTATATSNTFSDGAHTPHHSGWPHGPGFEEKDGDTGLHGPGVLGHDRGFNNEPGFDNEPGVGHHEPVRGFNDRGAGGARML